MHEFSNVAAVVVILAFVAIYKTAGCDIAGLLVREEALKPAINGLFVQTLILTALSASVIFSLHRLDIIVGKQQVMLAADCCLLVVLYQVWSGFRQVTQASK